MCTKVENLRGWFKKLRRGIIDLTRASSLIPRYILRLAMPQILMSSSRDSDLSSNLNTAKALSRRIFQGKSRFETSCFFKITVWSEKRGCQKKREEQHGPNYENGLETGSKYVILN